MTPPESSIKLSVKKTSNLTQSHSENIKETILDLFSWDSITLIGKIGGKKFYVLNFFTKTKAKIINY